MIFIYLQILFLILLLFKVKISHKNIFYSGAITLYPFILINSKFYAKIKDTERYEILVNHEKTHIEQQKELLIMVFYILYLLEFFIRLCIYQNNLKAYLTISFEVEAYTNQDNLEYLNNRKKYNWIKYVFTKNDKFDYLNLYLR